MTVGTTSVGAAAAHTRDLKRSAGRAVFSLDLLRILAVDEFVDLPQAERAAWAKAHGVERVITVALMKAVREAHANRATNKRLGLPDPIRGSSSRLCR